MAALSSLSYAAPTPAPASASAPTPPSSPSAPSDVHLHLSLHASLPLSSLPFSSSSLSLSPTPSLSSSPPTIEMKSEEKKVTAHPHHRTPSLDGDGNGDQVPPLLRASSIIAALTHDIADYRETLTCSIHQRPLRDITLAADTTATTPVDVTKSSASSPTSIIANSSKVNGGGGGGAARLKCRRVMRHHFGKITCAVWACDSRQIVSTSTDQTVAFSDAVTAKRLCRYPTRANWTMACAWSPLMHHVAMTNTANTVLVCRVPTDGGVGAPTVGAGPTARTKLDQHCEFYDQWSRSVRWLTDTQLITGNGDGTLTVWDVPTHVTPSTVPTDNDDAPHVPLHVLHGHTADVYAVRPSPTHGASIVASCSSDHSVAIWDLRIGGGSCTNARVQQLLGHDSDVKALNWLRNGHTLVSGGSDSTCRMWDVRCASQVQSFHSPKLVRQCVSLDVSVSGRILFTSYDPQPWPCPPTGQQIAPSLITWDTLTGEMMDQYVAHENKIEEVQVSPDGSALLTASWDTSIKIWTY